MAVCGKGNAGDADKDFGFGKVNSFAKAGEAAGPAAGDFDARAWRMVNLPHDWVVELGFDKIADKGHGFKPVGRAFPENSIGWYRKEFQIPKEDLGRRISIQFDGAFRDSIVWVNGHYMAQQESGYSPFRYDITDVINYGGKNSVAVRCDATQSEGWFYEGAGIYRHVWLEKTSPVHVAPDGVFVTTVVGKNNATVTARVSVINEGREPATVSVESAIVDAEGKEVGKIGSSDLKLEKGKTQEVSPQVDFMQPRLWSLEDPYLFKVVTTVKSGDTVVDRVETAFGIRTIEFDAEQGFLLTGHRVEIKGTCNHQDHAGIGAALPDRMQYYRVERLKEMGCNAIRTSHNAPTPELLEACDRLGMLVMDENRLMGTSPVLMDYLKGQVLRDRNHPSVIIWSIGNEEGRIQGTDVGARIARTMQDAVHELDPTRKCTVAMNGQWGKGFSNVIDVQGFNYKHQGNIDQFRKSHPAMPEIGTEESSAVTTRGIYVDDKERGYLSAYDIHEPGWGSTAEDWWTFYDARPFIAGAFVWTGFDYRGEPTPYSWPCINSHFGIMDTCGFPKDNFYYYQAWWTDKPMVHLLPHWNWKGSEGKEIDVWAHSNCDEVELFLNDASLGRRQMKKNSNLEWKVKYAPGTLLARGYKDGKEIATEKVETTGEPAAVKLSADRTTINGDGEDVSVVTVEVLDEKGRHVPTAGDEIGFEISGPGKIVGVGNGDPSCHEADQYVAGKSYLPLKNWRMRSVAAADVEKVIAGGVESKSGAVDLNDWRLPALNRGDVHIYRAEIDAPAMKEESATIVLGPVTGEATTYVNGKPATGDARELLHEGSNVVMVVVKSNQPRGGLRAGGCW